MEYRLKNTTQHGFSEACHSNKECRVHAVLSILLPHHQRHHMVLIRFPNKGPICSGELCMNTTNPLLKSQTNSS